MREITIDIDKAKELVAIGYSYRQISNELDCSLSWCKKYLLGVKRRQSIWNKLLEFDNKYCVYAIYDNDGINYMGSSSSIISRLKFHKTNGLLDNATELEIYVLESYPEMMFSEAKLVLDLEPKLNKSIIGNKQTELELPKHYKEIINLKEYSYVFN